MNDLKALKNYINVKLKLMFGFLSIFFV